MAIDQDQEYGKTYGQVMARAWADDDVKAELMADPTRVLRENGLTIPEGLEVRLFENTDKVMYLPIWQLSLLQGYGPRVAESGLGLIADYPWSAPYEDLRLK